MGKYFVEPGSLETETKKQIKKYFKDNGIWYVMQTPSAIGNSVGTSDFQALKGGLFIAVEAKRNLSSAKATNNQLNYIKSVNDNGGFGMVVRCEEDIETLDAKLKLLGIL